MNEQECAFYFVDDLPCFVNHNMSGLEVLDDGYIFLIIFHMVFAVKM